MSTPTSPTLALPMHVAIASATGTPVYIAIDGTGMTVREQNGGGTATLLASPTDQARLVLQLDTSTQYASQRSAGTYAATGPMVNVGSTQNPDWFLRVCPHGDSHNTPAVVNVQFTVWLMETFLLHQLAGGLVAFESLEMRNTYLRCTTINQRQALDSINGLQQDGSTSFRLIPLDVQPAPGWLAQMATNGNPPVAAGPCLLPGQSQSILPAVPNPVALTPTTIAVYLPRLGAGPVVVNAGPFSLTANTDPGTRDLLPAVLTMDSTGAYWNFQPETGAPSPTVRSGVRALVADFLVAAANAANPTNATVSASSLGIALLQQAIARWMPQTFAESQLYALGLDTSGGPGQAVVDLRPGMILRLSYADFLNDASLGRDAMRLGFAGGASTDFDITAGPGGSDGWQVDLDPFIARLVAAGVLQVTPQPAAIAGRTTGVADPADLYVPGFAQPFCRLFIPGQLADASGAGDTTLAGSFSLGTARSYGDLAHAQPTVFFRGRTVVRVFFRVLVNGVERVVPIGTTLGHILDQAAVRSPMVLRQVVVERAMGPGIPVFGPPGTLPNLDGPTRFIVRADPAAPAGGLDPVDLADLPLVPGDRISWP